MTQESDRLLYKIAYAYYIGNERQGKIAKQFGYSRIKISRLLKQAKDNGMIKTTICLPKEGMAELERKLENEYGLDEVIIVPVEQYENHESVIRELGPVAAELVTRRITGNETVGISWGTSVLSTINALPFQNKPDVTFIQVIGGLGPPEKAHNSNELVRSAAQKFNAKFKVLPAPGFVPDQNTAEALRSDIFVSETINLASECDMMIIGIGAFSNKNILINKGSILSKEDYDRLSQVNALGDMVLYFFDENGKILETEMAKRIVGISYKQLKKTPFVIAVAGGELKTKVIQGALKCGVINILVTDEITARSL